jgi:hypothetical protein
MSQNSSCKKIRNHYKEVKSLIFSLSKAITNLPNVRDNRKLREALRIQENVIIQIAKLKERIFNPNRITDEMWQVYNTLYADLIKDEYLRKQEFEDRCETDFKNKTVIVNQSLNIGNREIVSLPENLTINGTLIIGHKWFKYLPNRLTIKKDLDIKNAHINRIPDDIMIEGDVIGVYQFTSQFKKFEELKSKGRIKGEIKAI